MAGLEDHFGEDARLEQQVADDIIAHLTTHAAEAWDTEASNRFSRVSPTAPYQISATPYWVRKHDEVGEEVFKRKGIGGRSHCASCHRDAATGHFDDQNIEIPKS